MIKTQHPTQPGFIGAVDNARRKRLLNLCDLTRSSQRQTIKLEWPDYHEQERAALNDLGLDGPKTIIPLARPCISPNPSFRDLSARSKFLAV